MKHIVFCTLFIAPAACDDAAVLSADTISDTGASDPTGIGASDEVLSPASADDHADHETHPIVGLSSMPDVSFLSSHLVLVQWNKGMPTIEIGSTSDWVCFLARFNGGLNGAGDRARVYVVDGKWYVRGDGAVEQVTAQCVSAQTMATPHDFTYTWSQSESYASWVGASGVDHDHDRICGLTELRGNFDGASDELRSYQSGLAWLFGGRTSSVGQGISGAVRCAQPKPFRCAKSIRSWKKDDPAVKLPASANPLPWWFGQFCVLTRISGKFDTSKDWVGLWYSGSDVMLGGGATTNSVSVEAQCTDGMVVGNPPEGFSDCH